MEVTLDALFQRIADEPERSRTPLLHNAIMVALGRDPHRAHTAAEEAIALSERYGDHWSIAMGWLLKGRVLAILARYAESLAASEKASQLFENLGDRLNTAHAFSDIGSALININEYAKAFDVLSKGLALAEELESDRGVVYSLNRMGYLWQRLGHQAQALAYWQRAFVIAERLGSEELQSTISNNIASIYVELGEHRQALQYFERNLAKARASRDLYREALSRVNIAELLLMESRFPEALQYQKRALELFRTLGHTHFEGLVLSNIGRLLEKKGQLQEALQYQQDAATLLDQSFDKQDCVRVQLRLGVLCRRMGDLQRGIELLLSARQAAIAIGSEQLQSKISKQLALSYEQQGDFKGALVEYQSYMKLRRSFTRAITMSVADRVRLRSEVEGASREKEIQRIRNTELADALEKVQALSAHYRLLNRQNTLLVDSITRKLQTPLARIAESVRLMNATVDTNDDDIIMKFLGSMEQESKQASRTVDMLLLAHALEAGKFVPEAELFDVAALASQVLDDFRNKTAVEFRLGVKGNTSVIGDASIVVQILNALVANAIAHAPEGSVVSVEIVLKGGLAVLRVTDSGPGLPRWVLRALSVPPDSTESGLPPGSGLYLARLFASAIRGVLHCERKKKNTCLILSFPAILPISAG